MAVETRRMTVAEFDEYAALPENAGLRLEFIGGDIVEAPSAPFVSEIAVEIAFRIKVFLNEQGLRGRYCACLTRSTFCAIRRRK